MSAVYNPEVGVGGSLTVVVEVLDEDGTAADLTGYTGGMQVRAEHDDTTVLATGTVTIAANVVTGVVTASALAADTTWTAAYYDIRIVNGTTVEYIVRGTIRRFPTVTR